MIRFGEGSTCRICCSFFVSVNFLKRSFWFPLKKSGQPIHKTLKPSANVIPFGKLKCVYISKDSSSNVSKESAGISGRGNTNQVKQKQEEGNMPQFNVESKNSHLGIGRVCGDKNHNSGHRARSTDKVAPMVLEYRK